MEGEPSDRDVQRRTLINRICEAFHVLPSAAERELADDPERLCLTILEQRAYEQAKSAFDRAKNPIKDLADWDGNEMMELVMLHAFELDNLRRERGAREIEEERRRREAEAE